MDNLITAAIAVFTETLDELTPDRIAEVEAVATLDMGDWLALGDLASRSLMEGRIDAATAQSMHVIHTNFRTTATLAERLVFLKVAHELMGQMIGAS